MHKRQVFIVGDSLFAETLTRTLTDSGKVQVVGAAPSLADDSAARAAEQADALIIAEIKEGANAELAKLLAANPDLPILRADLNTTTIQVITSHRIDARTTDLLAALTQLPKRKKVTRDT